MQLTRPHMAAERFTSPLLGSGVITGIGKRCLPSVSEVSGWGHERKTLRACQREGSRG